MLHSEEPRALKVSEVAQRLRVDPRTIYRMIERGELRGVKAGRVWRVPAESLEAYLQTGEPRPRLPLSKDRTASVNALMGKYAYVRTSSDEFAARKQEDIDLENRRWESRSP